MSEMLLTAYNGAILGPIAKITWLDNEWHVYFNGKSWNYQRWTFYYYYLPLLSMLLMFPLTYKQQKFSKLSQKMNLELQAIQKKYKDKKDQAIHAWQCRTETQQSMRSTVFHRWAAVCRC